MMKRLLGALLLLSFVLVGTVQAADYVVQLGDTLSEIALEVRVPLDRLARLNRLKDPDYIQAGQILKYVSEQDIRDAIEFCDLASLGFSMGAGGALTTEWINQLKADAEDLREGRIRYVEGEPGVSAEDVLEMAKSLRLQHRPPCTPVFGDIRSLVTTLGDHFSNLRQP